MRSSCGFDLSAAGKRSNTVILSGAKNPDPTHDHSNTVILSGAKNPDSTHDHGNIVILSGAKNPDSTHDHSNTVILSGAKNPDSAKHPTIESGFFAPLRMTADSVVTY